MKEQEAEKERQEEVTETERQAHYSNPLKFGKGGPSKLRQQFSRGMTYFLVVAASLLFYFALLRLTSFYPLFYTDIIIILSE